MSEPLHRHCQDQGDSCYLEPILQAALDLLDGLRPPSEAAPASGGAGGAGS